MRPLHTVVASMGLLAASLHCSSSQQPPVVAPPSMPPSVVVAAPVADLTEVPPPDTLVAIIRTPALRRLAHRLGVELGVGEALAQSLVAALPALLNSDEALAHVVDLDGPADMAIHRPGTGDPVNVVSFSTVPLPQVEAALSDGHQLLAAADNARRVESTRHAHQGGLECFLAPAAPGNGAARLLCGAHAEDVTPVVPFLSRSLPRTALDASGPDLVADLSAESARRMFMPDAQTAADRFVHDVTPGPDPNNPAYAESVTGWAHDVASSYPLALGELASLHASLDLAPAALDLRAEAVVSGTSAPMLRRWLDATRGQHPSPELFAHLPPDGYAYLASSLGLEPYRTSLNLAVSAVAANLVRHTHLLAPDNTALRTAIAALFAQDRASVAIAAGGDPQNRVWFAAGLQVSTPPAQFIANVRALLAAIKRPLVARAISADLHEDVAHWTIAPAGPGIPPGALFVRLPQAAAAHPAAPSAAHAPPPAHPAHPVEILLVPEGGSVWVYAANDARALYRASQAAHPLPVPEETLSAEGVSTVLAVVPGHLQGLFFDNRPLVQLLDRAAHDLPDHALTPAVLVASATALDAGAHIGMRLTVPASALHIVHESPLSVGRYHPANAENVASSGGNLLSSGENLPSSGENLPSSGENLPSSGENLLSSGGNLLSSGGNLPSSGGNLPSKVGNDT